jgi:hypothetical protein
MDDNVIEIKLVDTNYLTRWSCTVCGGHTDKVPVLAESDGPPSSCIRVCEQCLEEGEIDARLIKHAQRIREPYATQLRLLVGKLRVPTYEQWKAACEQHEAYRHTVGGRA